MPRIQFFKNQLECSTAQVACQDRRGPNVFQSSIDIPARSCYNHPMMSTETTVEIASYRLPVVIERVNGSYQATSPALDGFLVLADTLDEVLALAPGVAHALLEAMRSKGKPPLLPLEDVRLPTQIEILVPA